MSPGRGLGPSPEPPRVGEEGFELPPLLETDDVFEELEREPESESESESEELEELPLLLEEEDDPEPLELLEDEELLCLLACLLSPFLGAADLELALTVGGLQGRVRGGGDDPVRSADTEVVVVLDFGAWVSADWDGGVIGGVAPVQTTSSSSSAAELLFPLSPE